MDRETIGIEIRFAEDAHTHAPSMSPPASEESSQEQHSELRAVLQRAASSRSEEHTFDGQEAKDVEKPAAVNDKQKTRRRRDEDESRPLSAILAEAGKRALGGGLPGAMAMGVQVGALMWLRTTMNYQYRYGTSTSEAMRALYKDGGIPRFCTTLKFLIKV